MHVNENSEDITDSKTTTYHSPPPGRPYCLDIQIFASYASFFGEVFDEIMKNIACILCHPPVECTGIKPCNTEPFTVRCGTWLATAWHSIAPSLRSSENVDTRLGMHVWKKQARDQSISRNVVTARR